jgi:type III restriction enzyme
LRRCHPALNLGSTQHGVGDAVEFDQQSSSRATPDGVQRAVAINAFLTFDLGAGTNLKEHFHTLYDNAPFDHFVYDSKRLGKVRQFATSNQIQIMVINIQSFQKDVADKDLSEMTEEELKKLNVINRENDRMSGRRPIEFIQAASPVVIIDEPQSVDTTKKSRRAIGNLNPMATLRYSATHRNPYNLLYKLDPIKAYDLRLVKRIEVASIRSDDNFNDAYVKLLKTDNKNGIKAQIEIHKEGPTGPKAAKLWVKQGDDLYRRSDDREAYRDGYIVQNIDCTPGSEYIEFNQGRFLKLGQEVGGLGDDIMKAQVYETVEQHLKKERALKGRGIKVLSLFFIDRVANYRIYNEDGTTSLGKIGQWFEEAYKELTAKPIYKGLIPFGVADVHNGYFSQDKQGHAKDTRGNTADDDDTYSLIMRDKERLLDPNVALRFIFSHSALREGWDNPNVFQICTLHETQSVERKRQEIGRGLRLPVNETGERVHDETINRLTVIANESYENFARKLQTEFEEDFGIKFGRVDKIAFAKLVRRAEDGAEIELGQDESAKIWGVAFYLKLSRGVVPQTLWKYGDVGHTQEAKKELLEYVSDDDPRGVWTSLVADFQRKIEITIVFGPRSCYPAPPDGNQ